MYKRLPLLILLIFFGIELNAQFFTIEHDGLERTYLVHLPQGYDRSQKIPLVIAMHGGTGNAANLERQSGLSDKGDKENFIVVYPEGHRGGINDIRTWNAGWCCGHASNNNIDDVGFIDKLIDILLSDYEIDQNRIYATGMSNGGYLSYRLACEIPSRIAAIAPVACSMVYTSCNPDKEVPIIQFHSYLDKNVLYQGGFGIGLSNHYSPPIDSVLNVWAQYNNCENQNNSVEQTDDLTHIIWTSCDCDSDIEIYITSDGGHSWPGGTKTILGDPTSNVIDANDLMWEFFQQHSLQCKNTVSSEENYDLSSAFTITPNPSSSFILFSIPEAIEQFNISIVDMTGKNLKRSFDNKRISISGLKSGTYFVVLRSTNYKLVKKLLVLN